MQEVKIFTGGHRSSNSDITIMQDGVIEALKGICEGLGSGSYILTGCTFITDPSVHTVLPGFIFHDGKIYPVDKAEIPNNNETLYWVVEEVVLPPSPLTYADTTTKNCHIRERMVLVDSASPPIGTYLLESEVRPFTTKLGITPQNGIIMYSGSISNFLGEGLGKKGTPVEGWALCNGANGTPNLRGQFVIGYNPADSDFDAIGKSGGNKTKDLRHRHVVLQRDPTTNTDIAMKTSSITDTDTVEVSKKTISTFQTGANDIAYEDPSDIYGPTNPTNFFSGTAGSETTDVMPPYYTLAYIMKL